EHEKRNFFLFWRHPKKDPDGDLKGKVQPPKRCKKGEDCATEPDLSAKIQPPKRCKVGEVCPVCAAGSFWDGSGKCVPVNQCPQGGYWNGSTCEIQPQCAAGDSWDPRTRRCESRSTSCLPGERWDGIACRTESVDPCQQLAEQLARQEKVLRSAGAAQQSACASDPTNQKCTEMQMNYRQETDRYVMLKDQYDQCRRRSGIYPVPKPQAP
ncbi:MAG TPA: hypothetical protein VLT90_08185, partial [Terriglobales bacterium]|nr:hypothetical protein [Terriglobales bacterium]